MIKEPIKCKPIKCSWCEKVAIVYLMGQAFCKKHSEEFTKYHAEQLADKLIKEKKNEYRSS